MSANVRVINLTGNVTLTTISSFRDQIVAGVDEMPMVLLSLSQATDIDLAGIQLIYAARRYAAECGKALHVTGAVPDRIARRFFTGGFIPEVIRDGRELDERLVGFAAVGVSNA